MKINTCIALTLLGLLFVCASEVAATEVSPGGLSITGQLLWKDIGDPYGAGSWIDIWSGPYADNAVGDPLGIMFTFRPGTGPCLGINDGVYQASYGTYHGLTTGFVGHTVEALDLTVQPIDTNGWPGSQNLLLEVRSTSSADVYWSYGGPFSLQPQHAYIQFLSPQVGYEFRLTAVPEPSSVVVVLLGLSLFCCGPARCLRRRGRRCS